MLMAASQEFTENTISLLRDAAAANMATGGRLGNVIEISQNRPTT